MKKSYNQEIDLKPKYILVKRTWLKLYSSNFNWMIFATPTNTQQTKAERIILVIRPILKQMKEGHTNKLVLLIILTLHKLIKHTLITFTLMDLTLQSSRLAVRI